ncbi:FidL-like protein [Pragia fontium]|uniref:FidL-like putative membrane protein n=1 Tax=Pragia fontium DSM 5563 = ATCC 49100 TaxID=1122977 RepID=A0AAJ4WB93_9GAMM|nr:FidL-like protein [Pragia fontium]SFC98027.1 FidL-like putative membrane protein [Pragia fontium DSM 5563 = ATCC 49100]
MRNIKLTVITTLIVTALFFSGIYLFYFSHQNNFSCSTNATFLFETNKQESEALMVSHMRFRFNNGKGINLITGYLQFSGREYVINRKVMFDYTTNKNHSYSLINTDVIMEKTDNLPKDLAERYLYRFSAEKHGSTHLTIINMNSGKKLFSSGTLPYFICE